ncbi:hypothetical protein AB0958_32190 [Streptomyces sp. NPDC006655]|uniref:hypothetical protein n=1 Tax=Streptomyces sp. NPDC006655 TaxID=3156898 RepID=UPI003453ADF6
MTGLAQQLRVSLLITLGVLAFPVFNNLVDGLLRWDFLAALGDEALGVATTCTLVAVLHTIVYGAMRVGRPETRGARGVRAGLVLLLVLDVVPLAVAGHVVLALIPVSAAVGGWGWAWHRRLGAETARIWALLFGVLSLLVQGVVALVMTMFR